MACSPGGRFLRSSLIFTPGLLALSTAVPTLAPWASFNATVTDLLAACKDAAISPAAATTTIILDIIFPFLLPASSRDWALRVKGVPLLHLSAPSAPCAQCAMRPV